MFYIIYNYEGIDERINSYYDISITPNNYHNDTHDDNVCIICFEYQTTTGDIPSHFLSDINYIKICNCKCVTHQNCLYLWFNHNMSCPICRSKVIENTYYNKYYNKLCLNKIRNKYISYIINAAKILIIHLIKMILTFNLIMFLLKIYILFYDEM